MTSLSHLLRGPIWSSLWYRVSNLFKNISRLFQVHFSGTSLSFTRNDIEQGRGTETKLCNTAYLPAKSHSHNIITVKHRPVIKQSSNQKLLMIGMFAEVYLVDGKIIRKAPRSDSEEDLEPVIREATIYNILGDHPRIAECLSIGTTGYVDVKYYPLGDLATYVHENKVTPDLQAKWFQQLLEAVVVIHSHNIIHSDLALRQFFVDDALNVRLGDFNSSQYPGHPALGYEKASHCLPRDYDMPNTIMSDLFALGSTLYELVAGQVPYKELYPIESEDVIQSSDHSVIRARVQRQHLADCEVEERYKKKEFPDVSHFLGGDVILGCWRGDFSSAEEALTRYIESQITSQR